MNPFLYTPIERINSLLEKYYSALEAISAGQSYSISSRSMTKADLAKVTEIIGQLEWAKRVQEGKAGRKTTLINFVR